MDHWIDRRREVGPDVARVRRRILQVGEDRHELRLAGEGHLAGQAVVEDAAQRVHVGPAVHVALASDLLRSDVVDRAGERARAGEPGAARHMPRDAEVGDEHPTAVLPSAFQQDGRRHQPTMDESARVRRVERGRAPRDDRTRGLRREPGLGPQQPPQIRPVDEPHREVEHALGLSGVIDRDDVRVIERRGRPTAAHEPLAERIVLGQGGVQDLQRDLTSQAEVTSQVDDRHRAAPEDRLDAMTGKLGAHPRIGLHTQGSSTRDRPRTGHGLTSSHGRRSMSAPR